MSDLKEEIFEIESARAVLNVLRIALPDLLGRCQEVHRLRRKLVSNAGQFEVKSKLLFAEGERDGLREQILQEIDLCGSRLQEVRRIVMACVSMDESLEGLPLPTVVSNFCREVPQKREGLLQELKEHKARMNIIVEASGSAAGPKSEALMLEEFRLILSKLQSFLREFDVTKKNLGKVRAESYVSKYESKLADLKIEQSKIQTSLEQWQSQAEQSHLDEDSKFDKYMQVCFALINALQTDLDDAELVEAIREDIKEYTTIRRRQPRRENQAKASKNTPVAPVHKNATLRKGRASNKGREEDQVHDLSFSIQGVGLGRQ